MVAWYIYLHENHEYQIYQPNVTRVVVSNICYFPSLFGETIPNLTSISFKMGWFNYQPENIEFSGWNTFLNGNVQWIWCIHIFCWKIIFVSYDLTLPFLLNNRVVFEIQTVAMPMFNVVRCCTVNSVYISVHLKTILISVQWDGVQDANNTPIFFKKKQRFFPCSRVIFWPSPNKPIRIHLGYIYLRLVNFHGRCR